MISYSRHKNVMMKNKLKRLLAFRDNSISKASLHQNFLAIMIHCADPRCVTSGI